MIKKRRFRIAPFIQVLALLPLAHTSFAGANFFIGPVGAQPSTVTPGGTVTANYILTNLTSTPRLGYFIRGLPNTVSLNTSGPGNCQIPINLNAKASCNLVFTISGPVSSNFAVCRGNSCTTATTPLNVQLAPNTGSGRRVAAGAYCNQSTCLPLLAQTDGTGSWTYPSSILTNLPGNPYNNPNFQSAACVGSFCIAVGGDDAVDTIHPFVAMSLTNGDNWTYPIGTSSTWPSDIVNDGGHFYAAACADSNWCVAAGDYIGAGSNRYVMIAQYLNGSWTYAMDSNNPPANMGFSSYITDASCSGNTCIAGGSYEDNTGYPLLLAQSTDRGATWSYKIDAVNGSQPVNYNGSAQFNATSCSGPICIAVGDYFANDNVTHGVVAVTNDAGSTYQYAIDMLNGPVPANFVDNGTLRTASCDGNLCIAGGFYSGSNFTIYNWLVQSTDGGATWTTAVDEITGPQLTNFVASEGFKASSCSGSICIAVGSYFAPNDTLHPFLMQTLDGGTTWTTVIDATTGPQLPGYLDYAEFNTANCVGNTCFAAGRYNDATGDFPMLVESINGGPWTYVIDNNIATLPSDYSDDGVFDGSAASNSLTAKLLAKTKKKQYHHTIWKSKLRK